MTFYDMKIIVSLRQQEQSNTVILVFTFKKLSQLSLYSQVIVD